MKKNDKSHLAWSLLAVLAVHGAALAPAFAAEKEQKKCDLKQYDSIDLVMSPSSVFVPVGVDGTRGYMILDLGSGISRLHQNTVKALGLKTRESPVESAIDGRKVTRIADFKSLTIGKATFGRGAFLVDPQAGGDYQGVPVFGALGTEAFSIVDIELDLSRRKLNLFSQDHCPGEVVYWAKAWGRTPILKGDFGTLYFPLELEEKKVEATFAPSRPFTTLYTDVSRRLYGFDETSPGIRSELSPEVGTVDHFRAMQLTAPGMQIRNSPVLLRSRPNSNGCALQVKKRNSGGAGYFPCQNVYPMALGRNVLEKMRFYFATKERMLYFTLADGSVSETVAPGGAKP